MSPGAVTNGTCLLLLNHNGDGSSCYCTSQKVNPSLNVTFKIQCQEYPLPSWFLFQSALFDFLWIWVLSDFGWSTPTPVASLLLEAPRRCFSPLACCHGNERQSHSVSSSASVVEPPWNILPHWGRVMSDQTASGLWMIVVSRSAA